MPTIPTEHKSSLDSMDEKHTTKESSRSSTVGSSIVSSPTVSSPTVSSSTVSSSTVSSHGPPTPPLTAAGPPTHEAEKNYQPKTLKFWLIMASNFVAMFLVALDRTIIATAIPRITDEFQSLGDIGWYGSAYMLTTAASQLLFGRIYKFYSPKVVYLASIVVFEIGSLLCGVAPNSAVLITGRAVAGFGSAGIFTGSMMILITIVPLHKRPMFQGVFGMVFGVAAVIGPLVGGAFAGNATWRWCFYMNLPIGGVAFIFLFFMLQAPQKPSKPVSLTKHITRLDPLGSFFFIPSIVALLLALQWGGATYAWSNGRIIALFVVFALAFVAFAAIQIFMPDTAQVPVRIISQRTVLAGTFFIIFLAGSMMLAVYYVPLWFQTVKGFDPVQSGIYTLPLVLSLVASSIMSGLITQRIGYYTPAMLLCPSIMAVGLGLLSTLHPGSSTAAWVGFQFLTGFGLGFGMQTVGLAVQTVLPREDVSTGLAITFFGQQLGGAVFLAVGQAILSNLLVDRLSSVPGLDPDAIVQSGATDLHNVVPAEDFDVVVAAYNFACTRIFLAGMGLALVTLACALCVEWRSVKKGKQGPGKAADAEAFKENKGDTEASSC
ncbi:MFS-type transporter VdtG like protein [Verticillium longisporum]|uniref:MFS-type transporter VdtG like protein n=1 Tax=Verticillium longisporum TaxID=100787 RepID=A0A8I2Z8Q8_VERLO|nr:MFS-type transporter VdtG like protein [Verticillium longisporum]